MCIGATGGEPVRHIVPRGRALLQSLLCSGSLLVLCHPALAGGALPTGGHYVAGQGAIAGSANGLTITQSGTAGIINWNSFSIGAGNTVQFNNGSGTTLNRVTGGDLSRIDGLLGATGSVYLINPQGIVVGPGGKVVTNGSFVASTRDISDSDFMGGGVMTASGTSNGDVINAGTITSANGDAILVGRSVTNNGTLSAPNGTAALAAGNQILLQPVGSDARIAVSGGTGDVTNAGAVKAAQAALISAGGDVYALAENGAGVISATGSKTVAGEVWLTAGGTAEISGTLTATNADGSGGKVTVRGTNIAQSGTIDASANQAEKAGGTVSVIATGNTTISGRIAARGGGGGKGGSIETSGHTLAIGGATVDAGPGGNWLLDPYDLTVDASAASTINTSLGGGTGVTLQTTASSASGPGVQNASGSGDITINSALSWSTAATLTLDAYHSIAINAPITVSGAGSVVLKTNDGGSGGDYGFGLSSSGFAGSIDYGSTDNGGTLSINGASYTLLYTMAAVQNINSGLTGKYALATSLDASSTSSWVPIGTDGTGAVQNSGNGFTGIFTGLGHTISKLTVNIGSNPRAGLFGYSKGTLRDVGMVGGSVSGGLFAGGLVADSDSGGKITNAYATGTVSGSSGYVGGLVGFDYNNTISNVYATGAVSGGGTGHDYVGGLVGQNGGGTISNAYATGAVNGHGAAEVGGLVGMNNASGTISNAYATGAVSGGSGNYVGGLVGDNDNATLSNAYATGAVNGSGSYVGGLVGGNNNGATITGGYWDKQTSGTSTGIGRNSNAQTVTGLTTAQLQGALPTGFSSSVWGTGSGLYPYLKWQYTSTPQAISGIAYSDAGVTALASGATAYTVSALVSGASLGSASTGANGYYYILAPSGTVASGKAVLVSSSASSGTRLASGADALDANSNVSGFDIFGTYNLTQTSDLTLSQASSDTATLATSAVGSLTNPRTGIANTGYIGTGASFTLNQSLTLSNGLYVKTTAGDITVANPLTLSGSNSLTLDSYHSLTLDKAVTVSGAGGVVLKTNNGGSGGDYGFGLSSSGFAGSIDYGSTDNGGTLSINGASYTLLYTMAAVQNINSGLTGKYALATSLDASSTSSWVPIGTDGAGNLSGNGFTGIFTGLGHTISKLTVNLGSVDYVGPFGFSEGTLRDVGMVGGAVTGLDDVGGLAGRSDAGGKITDAYVTGTVSGSGGLFGGLAGYLGTSTITHAYATGAISGGSQVGGLVGNSYNSTISDSYATGAVSGSSYAGGLVGFLDTGTISNAYATGTVSSSSFNVGGLVGSNQGSAISNAYATGAVSGASEVGGLVGQNDSSATITGGYWNKQTSGQNAGIGIDYNSQTVTGLTTAQLQGTLPSGFSSSVWGTGSGLYPYLIWQYTSTPQVISGIAYSDAGVTPLASGSSTYTVSALADGTSLGSATTSANGYYYILAPSGTLTGTQQLLTYVSGSSVKANTYIANASGNTTADLYGSWLRISSNASTTSAMFTGLSTALGSKTGSDFLYSGSGIASGTSFGVVSGNAGGLAIDTALNVGSNTISLNASGPVSQSLALTAGSFDLLGSSASYTLTNAGNSIGTLAANTGAVSLIDSGALTVSTVTGTAGVTSTGAVTLNASGNLTIASGAQVTAGSGSNAVLVASGNFLNNEGSNAVAVSGGGRWLIYSNAPGTDTFGSLDSGNTAIWNATYATLAPGSVSASGDRYIFAYQPTLTVTTTNASKTYGNDGTATVAAAYTASGYQSGVASAFLGDNAASVYSGGPSVTSTGSGGLANAGSYAIAAATGSLTALNGYAFAFTNTGTLTVNTRALTITADSLSRLYGDANPAFTYAISSGSLVNGDTLSGALATTAGATSNVGTYAITQGTLVASSNYALSYVGGTLTVLPIPSQWFENWMQFNRPNTLYGSDLRNRRGGKNSQGLQFQVGTPGHIGPFHMIGQGSNVQAANARKLQVASQ